MAGTITAVKHNASIVKSIVQKIKKLEGKFDRMTRKFGRETPYNWPPKLRTEVIKMTEEARKLESELVESIAGLSETSEIALRDIITAGEAIGKDIEQTIKRNELMMKEWREAAQKMDAFAKEETKRRNAESEKMFNDLRSRFG